MLNESKNPFSKFTNKYALSKTLRFELKPIAETKKYLQNFIDSDTKRAEEYKELKKIIDEFHKDYIVSTLSHENILDKDYLKDFFNLWSIKNNKEDKELLHEIKEKHNLKLKKKNYGNKEIIEVMEKQLRKQIIEHFETLNPLLKSFFKTANEEQLLGFLKKFDKTLYKEFIEKKDKTVLNQYLHKPVKRSIDKSVLFSKEFIQYLLPAWVANSHLTEKEEKQKVVKKFEKWTTYLQGFYENRKNMYSQEEQGTAIAHRIINENLVKFFSNLKSYKKIKSNYQDLQQSFEEIKSNFKEELNYFSLKKIEDIFKPEFFNNCLSQKGIDHYNTFMGGKTLEGGKNLQGINQYINLYRQKKKSQNKDIDIKVKYSNKNLSVMELLYKQVLSDRESHSFILDEFENKKELIDSIDKFSDTLLEKQGKKESIFLEQIKNLFTKDLSQYELDQVYIKKSKINQISHHLFGDWGLIASALRDILESAKSKKDFYSLKEVDQYLKQYLKKNDNWHLENQKNDIPQENILVLYFRFLFDYETEELEKIYWKLSSNKNEDKLLKSIRERFLELKKQNNVSKTDFSEKEVETIQKHLNSLIDLFHLVDTVYLEKDRKKVIPFQKDTNFYNNLDSYRQKFFPIRTLYNKSRNFILSKKNQKKKIKINFEKSTLLDGWDINKETYNLTVLLRKKDEMIGWKYYLGVMNKDKFNKANCLFDYHVKVDESEKKQQEKKELQELILHKENNDNFYEKMNYKQIAKSSKDIQNLIKIDDKIQRKTKDLDKLKEIHFPTEIWKIKKKESYKKGDSFNKEDLVKIIDFYKGIAKEYWSHFNLSFKNSDQYKDFNDFTSDIDSQGYKLNFDKIKSSYIEEKVKTGELLLFEIYSKDFSTKSKNRGKSKDNLHTLYFKGLFEEENLRDLVLKLNGQAEIFYRKATKKFKVTHKKNEPIRKKNPNNSGKSTFEYDLIKDKRFTEDKFFFHFPISLNFKSKGINSYSFNQEALKFLKDNKEINIIGIDRGERHLAYYTVIDRNRKIREQGSFNKMKYNYDNNSGKKVEIEKDYHGLLDKREKERNKSRKEWKKIENIKELKSGYLSYLVYEISKLMIKYKAIVVFEDLNSGFKRGRFKFEKQVYQKLEKALIDKLNYLVFKDKKSSELGGYLKAYQLTAPFESFQKMGKQTGFLFYTPAYYTSRVCPLTGFINLIYPKYKNVIQSQNFFSQFEKIYFDEKNNYFVFKYQDSKFNPKKNNDSKSFWKVCTYGDERYKWNRKERKMKKINVTEDLKNLFVEYNIKYKQTKDLKSEITKQEKKSFFYKLTDFLQVTLQLRHINPDSKDEREQDFILSPVADESGRFFDSRKANKKEPQDADANGAYHIALKGLMSLKNIKPNKDKFKIQSITNKDWFEFIRESKPNKTSKAS